MSNTDPADLPGTPGVPGEFLTDQALMGLAHSIAVYYAALIAEGFDPGMAIGIVIAWQTTLITTAASAPRPQDSDKGTSQQSPTDTT